MPHRDYLIHPTRFEELGYAKLAPGLWRVVDTSAGDAVVGPHYRTRVELLTDLERYATEYGATRR
jgi:hypothetical protein